MKIVIDGTRCQGNARCWAQDPVLFALNDEGYLEDGTITVPDNADAHLRASRAVRACPERALRVEEE